MSTTKQTLSGQVAPEQIEQWKKRHGDIFGYAVDDKIGYLRRPSRQVVSLASVAGQNDPFKFAETVLVNCWLGGDEALRTEDRYFMGLAQKINEIVEIKVGEIKKL